MTHIRLSELTILLVEPSDMQVKHIRKHLDQAGVSHITHVKDGEAALIEMQRYEPDLVISTMYLPDMSANDLIQLIRLSPNMEHVPFMLISSETRFEQLDPIRQAGVVAILKKPYSQRDLMNGLENTLAHLNAEDLHIDNYDVEHLRLLLVDDSTTARRHMHRILNSFGIELITEAEDGKEAVRILEQQEFDLIITDYNMPEMNGQQLIEHVRRDMNNTYVPIVMITSEEDEERLAAAHEAGVSAICDKPFNPEGVKSIVFSLLNEEAVA